MTDASARQRESNIEWIGNIPSDWDVQPLFAVARAPRRSNSALTETNLLSLSYGRIIRKDISTNDGLLPASFDTYQIVEPGDIVFRFTDLQNDKRSLRNALVMERGIITSAYLALTPTQCIPEYLNYLMRSYDTTKVFYSMGGGLRQSLKFDDVKRMPVLVPPLESQKKLVAYLDRETVQIDELIGKQNALIELLGERRKAVITRAVTRGLNTAVSMTSTGSSWFPSIPSTWVLAPAKYGATLIQTGPFGSQLHSSDYVDGGIPLVNPSHMVDGKIAPAPNVAVSEAAALELRRHSLKVGDIIVARRGELGRAAVVSADSAGFLCGTGSALVRLDPRAYIPSYFFAAFSSTQSRDALLEYSVGSTMDNLNAEMLANLRLPCPPIAEQSHIMDYLEDATDAINDLIAKSTVVVSLLGERRLALTTAAVTGKIDLRGAA